MRLWRYSTGEGDTVSLRNGINRIVEQRLDLRDMPLVD